MVSGASSLLIGLIFTLLLVATRKQYPSIFTNSWQIQELVQQLTPLLGISIVLTNVQYNLSGTLMITS